MTKNWILVFICAIVASCSTDVGNFQIGDGMVDSKSSIVMLDSFSVKYSTVVMDSIATSNPSQGLVGFFSNDQIGTTELKHYFNFDLASDISSVLDNTLDVEVLDSMTLKMDYSGFSIGDTTQTFTLELHRLQKELELQDIGSTTDYLFNNNSFPYDETALTEYVFTPYPTTDDSIEFRINDTFAEELFNLFVEKDVSVSNDDDFNTLLKGFVISSPNSHAILGFNTSDNGIQLKMYTHISKVDLTENEYDFDLTADNTNFNQSITNRTGTVFENLVKRTEKIPSTKANNLAYTQGTTGVICRLDFPSLNDAFALENHTLIKAQLVLIPAEENNYDDLPSSLIFYTSGKTNKIGTNLTTTSSSGTTTSVTATLVSDYLTGTYYYIADLSDYFLDEMSDYYYDTNQGLLVMFPSSDWYDKSQLLIFSDKKVSKLSPALNLYFLKNE